MYIEHYTVKIISNCHLPTKTVKISANTVQEAHKKVLFKTNNLTEEISEITDSANNVVYTLNGGFNE